MKNPNKKHICYSVICPVILELGKKMAKNGEDSLSLIVEKGIGFLNEDDFEALKVHSQNSNSSSNTSLSFSKATRNKLDALKLMGFNKSHVIEFAILRYKKGSSESD